MCRANLGQILVSFQFQFVSICGRFYGAVFYGRDVKFGVESHLYPEFACIKFQVCAQSITWKNTAPNLAETRFLARFWSKHVFDENDILGYFSHGFWAGIDHIGPWRTYRRLK